MGMLSMRRAAFGSLNHVSQRSRLALFIPDSVLSIFIMDAGDATVINVRCKASKRTHIDQ